MVKPVIEIEARPYGPDSSADEVAALQARVSIDDANILVVREIPISTPFSIDVLHDRIEQLLERHQCSAMLVDLRTSGRSDAATRQRINERTARLMGRLRHIAVIVPANPLVKASARFAQASMPVPVTLHESIEDGMEALRRGEQR